MNDMYNDNPIVSIIQRAIDYKILTDVEKWYELHKNDEITDKLEEE